MGTFLLADERFSATLSTKLEVQEGLLPNLLPRLKYAILFSLVLLAACSQPAEAKGPVLIGWGEDVSQARDLPNDAFGSTNVGYLYSYISVFFIPVFTWNGRYVVYEGVKFAPIKPEERAKLEEKFGKFGGGLWVRYVDYLWLVLGLVAVGWMLRITFYDARAE